MSDNPAAPADVYAPPPQAENSIESISPICGFWRRLGAFAIDAIVLGVTGMVVGMIALDALATNGWLARAVGFSIALAYAGTLNSRIAGGQTLGKRLLGIRVVRLDGSLLSLPRALARQVVFSLPFFLNNAPFSSRLLNSWWSAPLTAVVFGGMFAIAYLFVFNRRDRRSLHDYAVGSVVVRTAPTSAPLSIAPLWRGHAIAIGIVALLSLLTPLLAERLWKTDTFAGMLPLYDAMAAEPGVLQAQVNVGSSFGSGASRTYVAVTLHRDQANVNDEAFARSVARDVLSVYPKAAQTDAINVSLVYGYDMVIASTWRSATYSFQPSQLQAQ